MSRWTPRLPAHRELAKRPHPSFFSFATGTRSALARTWRRSNEDSTLGRARVGRDGDRRCGRGVQRERGDGRQRQRRRCERSGWRHHGHVRRRHAQSDWRRRPSDVHRGAALVRSERLLLLWRQLRRRRPRRHLPPRAAFSNSGGQEVCGCDGKTYAFACLAFAAGVDVTDASACKPPLETFPCGDQFCTTGTYLQHHRLRRHAGTSRLCLQRAPARMRRRTRAATASPFPRAPSTYNAGPTPRAISPSNGATATTSRRQRSTAATLGAEPARPTHRSSSARFLRGDDARALRGGRLETARP